MTAEPSDIQELLSAYLDDELDEPTRMKVVEYLEHHEGAVRLLKQLQENRDLLRTLPSEAAPNDFSEDVMSAVEKRALLGDDQKSPTKKASLGPIRAVAALVILIGGAGVFTLEQMSRRVDTPESQQTTDMVVSRTRERNPIEQESTFVAVDSMSKSKKLLPRDSKDSYDDALAESIASGGALAASSDARADTDRQVGSFRSDHTPGSTASPALADDESQREGAPLAPVQDTADLLYLTVHLHDSHALRLLAERTVRFLEVNQFSNIHSPLDRAALAAGYDQQANVSGSWGLGQLGPHSEQYVVNATPGQFNDLVSLYTDDYLPDNQVLDVSIDFGALQTRGKNQTAAVAQLLVQPEWQTTILGDATWSFDQTEVDERFADGNFDRDFEIAAPARTEPAEEAYEYRARGRRENLPTDKTARSKRTESTTLPFPSEAKDLALISPQIRTQQKYLAQERALTLIINLQCVEPELTGTATLKYEETSAKTAEQKAQD